jgi:hypothetical protein
MEGVPYGFSNKGSSILKRSFIQMKKGKTMFFFKNRARLAISTFVVLLCGMGLAYWFFFWPDPRFIHAQELSRKLRENISMDQRRQLSQEMRQVVEGLSQDQRRALARDRRQEFEKQIAKYFTLPKEERNAYLDAQIDRMEEVRRQWQQGPINNPGIARSNTRSNDPDERDRRRRDRLDESTPEQRAEFAAFFQALRDRRLQRGLPGWGGGR